MEVPAIVVFFPENGGLVGAVEGAAAGELEKGGEGDSGFCGFFREYMDLGV